MTTSFSVRGSLWRRSQKKNFRDGEALADFLCLSPDQRKSFFPSKNFPLNLPFRLAEKIRKSTLEDPILCQFLPVAEENQKKEGFTEDPVGDLLSKKTEKLIHKYEGRALLLCSRACAMHCRYCFRKNLPRPKKEGDFFQKELSMIAADPSIKEVILSGGDPLSLSNEALSDLIVSLDSIAHVKRLRFHSRFLIGIPERIDDDFLEILENMRLRLFFVVHCNHFQELDEEVFLSIKKIQKIGTVLSQTVLLRRVNDDAYILQTLFESLADHGIIPYYLHQLDRARGVQHFEVPEEKGRSLIKELAKRLPGYAVPNYVKEIAGKPGKSLILA